MKRLFLLSLAVVALAAAPSAAAKPCVRIQAPATAEAGKTVRVVVRLYMPTWKGGRLVKLTPLSSWPSRLELTVSGPNGEWRLVTTRGSHDGVGVAQVRFASAGRWQLDAFGWEHAPRTCAPTRSIRVA